MDLMADVGATNTRCALVDERGAELADEYFHNADFSNLPDLLAAYVARRAGDGKPRRAALAIAAPILGDDVRMTNIDWRFSQRELAKRLGLDKLVVCNDFAAVAWALPQLGAADVRKIGGGTPAARGARAAVGPGSGLGVSALVPAGEHGWAAVTGEGGHVSLAASTDEEAAVIAIVRRRFGHCSAERLISGQGLQNLHSALAELAGRGAVELPPERVTALAKQGDDVGGKALAMFFALLGAVAGDVALTTGARGGVYIAGGIVPQLLPEIERSEFRQRFEAKGRYRDYMAGIPTLVITAALPAFRGLRQLLDQA
jgi:glucokinase